MNDEYKKRVICAIEALIGDDRWLFVKEQKGCIMDKNDPRSVPNLWCMEPLGDILKDVVISICPQ